MAVYGVSKNQLSVIYGKNGQELDAAYSIGQTELYKRFIVQFLDWDGTVLSSEKLVSGAVPSAPSPVRDGYIFTGWEPEVIAVVGDSVYTAVYRTSQATAVYRFPVCADLHVRETTSYTQNINAENALSAYQADDSIDAIVCLGDFSKEYYGLLKTSDGAYTYPVAVQTAENFANCGKTAYIITGNHDPGLHGSIDADFSNWKSLTGCDPYFSVQIPDSNFLMVFVSGIAWGQYLKPIYTSEARAWVRSTLAAAKEDGKRVLMFTHYCYPVASVHFGYRAGYVSSTNVSQEYVDGTDIDSLVEQWYGTSTGGSASGNAYSVAGDDDDILYQDIAAYDNILWFSGHVHTPWKWQEGIPHIKVYTIPGGASMINLPSLGYSNQDALVELMSDGTVVVRARQGGVELGGQYVYTWDGTNVTYNQ